MIVGAPLEAVLVSFAVTIIDVILSVLRRRPYCVHRQSNTTSNVGKSNNNLLLMQTSFPWRDWQGHLAIASFLQTHEQCNVPRTCRQELWKITLGGRIADAAERTSSRDPETNGFVISKMPAANLMRQTSSFPHATGTINIWLTTASGQRHPFDYIARMFGYPLGRQRNRMSMARTEKKIF